MRQLARLAPLTSALALTVAIANPVFAEPAYLGAEILVNSDTINDQERPAIADTGDGGFVVAWESFATDGDNGGIMARRFGPTGSAIGGQFTVNTYVALRQGAPKVSAASDGAFVVVWEGDIQDGVDYGVFGQRYDTAGAPLGTEFAINTHITGNQQSPDVSVGASGEFVVVWSSQGQDGSGSGVIARLFGADGLPASDEFVVNAYTSQGQYFPRVDSNDDGSFVVVWASYDGRDGAGYGVFGQRFDGAGQVLGTEFAVNTFTTADQNFPSVAMTEAGFVVAWQSLGVDGSNEGIAGRRYDAAGAPIGDEFVVNTYDLDSQVHPDVVGDAAGGFVVAWDSIGLDGDGTALIAQRFDDTAVADGLELLINTAFLGDQNEAAIAATPDGRFIVAWNSAEGDGSGTSIAAQRMLLAPPQCGDATEAPLSVVGRLPGGTPDLQLTATDALVILNGSVGIGLCPLCVCDVNNSMSVTATDALIVLNAAIGVPQNLVCPNLCI
ncbi:MAG: hypothetical protein V3R77_01765 [Candidatus Binatia bacterium]